MQKRLKKFTFETRNSEVYLVILWESRNSENQNWVEEPEAIKLSASDSIRLLSLNLKNFNVENSSILSLLSTISLIASRKKPTNPIPLKIKLLNSVTGDIIFNPSITIIPEENTDFEKEHIKNFQLDENGFFTLERPLWLSTKIIFSAENYNDLNTEIPLLGNREITLRMSPVSDDL
jgi:hypothetical protein